MAQVRWFSLIVPQVLLAAAALAQKTADKETIPVHWPAQVEVSRVPWRPDIDAPIQPPPLGPLDQLLPMPNPAPFTGVDRGPGPLVVYNFETGTKRYIDPPAGSPASGVGGAQHPAAGGLPLDENDILNAFGTMYHVTDAERKLFPYSTAAKLAMRFPSGETRYGSGVMIADQVVLTCAHNIDSTELGLATGVWVFPGWDGRIGGEPIIPGPGPNGTIVQNFGYATVRNFVSNQGWTRDRNPDFDIAILDVSSRSIGVLTGAMGWAWGATCNVAESKSWRCTTFPGEACDTNGNHNGQRMLHWSGTIDGCAHGAFAEGQFTVSTPGNCFDSVWTGMSGGGLYYTETGTRYAAAVVRAYGQNIFGTHTTGYFCRLHSILGPAIAGWETAWRGATIDVEALRLRLSGSARIGQGTTIPAATFLVSNTSTADPAPANYIVDYRISQNNQITAPDTLIATYVYTNVNFDPRDRHTFGVPAAPLPVGTAPGRYFLGVVVTVFGDAEPANNTTVTWDAQEITVTPAAADDCVNAPTISDVYVGYDFDNLMATSDGSTASCVPQGSSSGNELYFRFLPATSGLAGFRTCGSGFDTVISVLSACDGDEIGCNDDDCWPLSQSSSAAAMVTLNVPVIIRIGGYNGARGSGVLTILKPRTPPANDNRQNAQPIGDGVWAYDLGAATPDYLGLCSAAYPEPADVWFRYTPECSGIAFVSTCGWTEGDSLLTVMDATGTATLACDDNACDDQSQVQVQAYSGRPILIRVAEGNDLQHAGSLYVHIDDCTSQCGPADFDGDGDSGTDSDIEAFLACLGGDCCALCASADFDGDGDTGTDADIQAYFVVLGGGNC